MRRFRFSIGGLMAVVLVAAVGLAALRDVSPFWLGAMYLLSRGMLALAILPAVFRRGTARAWWLGFCLFGWGYLYLIETRTEPHNQRFPTARASLAVKALLGHPSGPAPINTEEAWIDYYFVRVGHSLSAIAAAFLGAVLARRIAVRSEDRTEADVARPPADGPPGRRWTRPVVMAWAGLAIVTVTAASLAPENARFWAGATFLLTLGLLAIAGVGAICLRGPRRHGWLGATLLGGGYFLLVFTNSPFLPLPAGRLLSGLRDGSFVVRSKADARVLDELEKPITLRFPDPTPVETVLRSISGAAASKTSPVLPIYVDPIGLQEGEQTPSSPVTIDVENVPIKEALRTCLDQINLTYAIRDGYVWVTSPDSEYYLHTDDPYRETANRYGAHYTEGISGNLDDSFLVVAHSVLALLAAGLGALAGPRIAGTSRRSNVSSEQA